MVRFTICLWNIKADAELLSLIFTDLVTPRSCQDYTSLSHEHTMCSSTPSTCAIYQEGVIATDRHLILDSHNKYRAKVARGEESKGLPGPQYSAADMQQLAWNEELAQVAQAWASSCPSYHDCHDCRKLLSSKSILCSYPPKSFRVILFIHAKEWQYCLSLLILLLVNFYIYSELWLSQTLLKQDHTLFIPCTCPESNSF